MTLNYEIDKVLQQNKYAPVIMTTIDEATFVIKPTEDSMGADPDKWYQIAPELADVICDKLSLQTVLGDKIPLTKAPAGYTNGFTFNNMPHYFAIAWHEYNFTMGIIIKFSASALDTYKYLYQECFNNPIDVHNIAQLLNEPYWEIRLSRIDLAIDYFNYDMSVNDLYQGLKSKKYIITNHRGRKNISKISAQEIDSEANTIYIGSKKKNTNSLLRIYNKYQEQLDNNGRYLHILNYCDSWIRKECSYKGTYSNQILALLLTIDCPEELSQLIVNKFLDKYVFYDSYTGNPLPFTNDLLKGVGHFPPLSSMYSRNNDLMSSISYLMRGSGLFPLLTKIEKIWGKNARNHFIIRLIQEYETNYSPNKDVSLWLNRFAHHLEHLNFHDFLEDCFTMFYQKYNITPKDSAKKPKSDVTNE